MPKTTDPYETLAAYYDTLHASLQEDIGLLLSLAAEGDPILELGCGTGRLLLPLARAGSRVIGLDRSLPMLRRACRRLQEEPAHVRQRIHLFCAEMSRFALVERRFALAFIPYNTLMHLSAAELVPVFDNARRHLSADGQLFMDVANPFVVEQTPNDHFLTLERTFEDPERGKLVLVTASNEVQTFEQRLRITWLFDASPLQGGVVERRVARVVYHYYFPHQLELALREAQLDLVGMYGSYRLDPFAEDADRLLILARRAS